MWNDELTIEFMQWMVRHPSLEKRKGTRLGKSWGWVKRQKNRLGWENKALTKTIRPLALFFFELLVNLSTPC